MSHYKPYPAYKESGVEWLGRVPEHWELRSLKQMARLDGGAGFPDDEQGVQGMVFKTQRSLVTNAA